MTTTWPAGPRRSRSSASGVPPPQVRIICCRLFGGMGCTRADRRRADAARNARNYAVRGALAAAAPARNRKAVARRAIIQGMAEITVRRAIAADLGALRAIFRAASLSNVGDRDALLEHPQYLEFDGNAIAEGRTWLAEGDAGPVGFVTVLGPGPRLELEDLFVDPSWMRHGVGTRLMVEAHRFAAASGASRIDVSANPHAIAFYRSVGFLSDGEVDTPLRRAQRLTLPVTASPPLR